MTFALKKKTSSRTICSPRRRGGDGGIRLHSRLAAQDKNKGIDQFLNWSMKQPPAASHMIRIPPAQVLTKEKKHSFQSNAA